MKITTIALAALLLPTAAMAHPYGRIGYDRGETFAFIEGMPMISLGCHRHCAGRAHEVTDGSIRAEVTAVAMSYGVPPALAHGIVHIESNYRCGARNGSATGIMQVMQRTARGIGITGNLTSCHTGLEAGMRYLRMALSRAGGSWCGAATLFNRGLGARPTSSGYCRKVMRFASLS